jgi:hypothetical protein
MAYGAGTMKKSDISEWNKWFNKAHENVEEDETSGHQRSHRTEGNVEKIAESGAYYVQILKWLCEAGRRKGPELWPKKCILHHDNAPAHKELSSSFWSKNRLLDCNTYPIPLILLQMTSGCFQK